MRAVIQRVKRAGGPGGVGDGGAFHQGWKFLHPHLGHRILFGDAIFPEGRVCRTKLFFF